MSDRDLLERFCRERDRGFCCPVGAILCRRVLGHVQDAEAYRELLDTWAAWWEWTPAGK